MGITYPSGNQVVIEYGEGGRASGMSLLKAGATTPVVLVSEIRYHPSGAVQSWTWGNSTAAVPNHYFREFDSQGRITRLPFGNILNGGVIRTITYDAAGRITNTEHVGNGLPGDLAASLNQSYGYDDLDRLTGFVGNGTAARYQYDASGNRIQLAYGGQTFLNIINPASNQLQKITGPTSSKIYSYDAAGNLFTDGTINYVYNARGRMQSAQSGAITASYMHNGLDQRAAKMVKSGPAANLALEATNFIYDELGRLIGEYDVNGSIVKETIYIENLALATLMPEAINEKISTFYVYSDHINTPRIITDAIDNHIVWRWDLADSFGASQPLNNSQTARKFSYNFRFPGQYHDTETNLNYNYHRNYDPQTGRYVQSDPIGLAGGFNTYAYVGGNPLNFVDPLGLAPGDRYKTVDAAGIQAIRDINPTSIAKNQEFAGRVYKRRDGYYSYTQPIPGTRDSADFGSCPSGTTNAGQYHTHGADSKGRNYDYAFSDSDMTWSERENVPSYLGMPNGVIGKYTPIHGGAHRSGSAVAIGRGAK